MKKSRSITLLLLAILLASACEQDTTTERQAVVAELGETVMPFDLERTTHVFEKNETGGLQQVLSDDMDTEQIQLIQSHLAEEAEHFSAGNFHDPAKIHGDDMPGLHALTMGHEQINITYTDLEKGGQILYATEDEALVSAIHEWFDAQVSDHGHHAQDQH